MNKEVESYVARLHWPLMKKSEVNNKHKNKYWKLKNILSVWSFKRNRLPYGRLMKHKYRLCAHKNETMSS